MAQASLPCGLNLSRGSYLCHQTNLVVIRQTGMLTKSNHGFTALVSSVRIHG